MKQRYTIVIVAAVLAVFLGVGMAIRMRVARQDFDKAVREALRTSEGYDQRFINMVNNLEEMLAEQASFGYTGGKDPMTGKERTVVLPPQRTRSRTQAAEGPKEEIDPIKLTAIIFDDDEKKFTAIIMDDERSYAVETGDVVAGRRVTRITTDRVFMESDTMAFFYDIFGKRGTKRK